ncbi:hypothetical protein [Miltoncostaea oceani]|uniref:hypothetical protein n=1 Tax=Miltoncostaea oceani TaxID=2843216 RepID=UPI001C3D13C2|nr:hypothetical protein [Miltoncostaea oceani]
MTTQILIGLILAGAAVWAWGQGTHLRAVGLGALALVLALPEASATGAQNLGSALATESASSLITLAIIAAGLATMLGWRPRKRAKAPASTRRSQ